MAAQPQKKIVLSLILIGWLPISVKALEWRLYMGAGLGTTFGKQPALTGSSSWEASEDGFVYISMMEKNETVFSGNASWYNLNLGLESWLSSQWGLSLTAGWVPTSRLRVDNQYRLDFLWYDGEAGYRRRMYSSAGNVNRFHVDLLLNRRFFLGYRLSAIASAGAGLHRFNGRFDRDLGWAATASGERYYFDLFRLPLRAEISDIRLVGQLGLAVEYRLSRTLSGRLGISCWLAKSFRVPYRLLDETQSYIGQEGHLVLTDVRDLLSERELQSVTIDPGALRLVAGLSLWL